MGQPQIGLGQMLLGVACLACILASWPPSSELQGFDLLRLALGPTLIVGSVCLLLGGWRFALFAVAIGLGTLVIVIAALLFLLFVLFHPPV
jgi:hypothetical protein